MILESFCPWGFCRRWQRPAPHLHAQRPVRCAPAGLRSSVCATHGKRVGRADGILLRNLLACERGLLEAYAEALRRGGRSVAEQELLARGWAAHQEHARLLGQRLQAIGELPPELRDDLWVQTARD